MKIKQRKTKQTMFWLTKLEIKFRKTTCGIERNKINKVMVITVVDVMY